MVKRMDFMLRTFSVVTDNGKAVVLAKYEKTNSTYGLTATFLASSARYSLA